MLGPCLDVNVISERAPCGSTHVKDGSLTFQELIDLLDIVEDRVQADGTGGLASLDQSLELSHGPVRPQELGGNKEHADPASVNSADRD